MVLIPFSYYNSVLMTKRRKLVLIGCAVLLLLAAAGAWWSYVVHWIAYGDLFISGGNDSDVSRLAFYAYASLGIALSCEGFLVGGASWLFLFKRQKVWLRLCVCAVLALLADWLTFALLNT